MHRHDVVRIDPFQILNRLRDIRLRCRRQMETAHDGMHLLDSGHGLRLPHGIDDAFMPTRRNHDQPTILDVEAGGVFTGKIVDNCFPFFAAV